MSIDGDRNPVEVLAEEFQGRRRRGDPVTPEEYAEANPEHADEILALFPALMLMEDLGGDSGGKTGSIASGGVAVVGAATGRLGDFRLLREVGRGGMGIVYEAEQESLARRVALKVLPAGSLNDPRQVQRFEREARSAARLHHTNIVPVFGVGREGETHYYVMQFIPGQGLDLVLEELKRLRGARSRPAPTPLPSTAAVSRPRQPAAEIAQSLATGRFAAATVAERTHDSRATVSFDLVVTPEPSYDGPTAGGGTSEVASLSDTDRHFAQGVARIGLQVAEALAYAHGQGILHRDIKPSNLLLERGGNVWVADFGLAKAVGGDDLTHTGDILGTIRYMAPERFQGQSDARGDVYALGLTLYELLALRPAFSDSDRASLIRQVTQEDPPRLRKLCRSVPADLETIIHKAIAREPNHRYATAASMADDLKRFLDGRPIKARRVSIPERTWRWCRRNPAVAALLVLLLAALAGMAGLWRRSERNLTIVRRHATGLELERAIASCERGDVARGLAGLGELLRDNADRPADEQYPIRANLAAWSSRLVVPETLATDVIQAVHLPDPADRLLAIGADGRVRVWDLDTGRPTGPVSGPIHRTTVRTSEYNLKPKLVAEFGILADGAVLAELIEKRRVRLWDLASGRPLGPMIELPWNPGRMALSPDRRSVAVVKAQSNIMPVGRSYIAEAGRWDVATGQPAGELLKWPKVAELTRPGWTGALSPDGAVFLERIGKDSLQPWDLQTGRSIGGPLDHPGLSYPVFLPGLKAIATVGAGKERGGQSIRLWEAGTGRPLGPAWEAPGLVYFPPRDAGPIATCREGDRLTFRDLASGEPRGEAIKPGEGFRGSFLSSDDRERIVTLTEAEARVWDVSTRRPVGKPMAVSNQSLFFINRDGTRVATGNDTDRVLVVWDVESGTRLVSFADVPLGAGWGLSNDGTTLIALDGDAQALRRWKLAGSDRGRTWLEESALGPELPTDAQRELRYRPRFRRNDRSVLELTDQSSRDLVGPAIQLDAPAASVTVSPRGDLVLTGGRDGAARLWSVATGQPIGSPMVHAGPVKAVVFARDSRSLAMAAGKQARFWDVVLNRPIGPPLDHPDPIKALQISADGRSLLVFCEGGRKGAYRWPLPVPEPGDPAAILARFKAPEPKK